MDESSLIDFNNDNCYKVSSPLIPAPPATKFEAPRLSDIEDPFDKVLRTIGNKDDPFECNTNKSFNNNIANSRSDTENKENIGHLVSPIQTPVKSKKYKKVSTTPLYISKIINDVKDISPNQLPVVSELVNISVECNTSDTSLQILSDSVLNSIDDLSTSFTVACNLPLPNSPDDEDDSLCTNKVHLDIPTVIQDESKNLTYNSNCSTSNPFNNAFIDHSADNLQNRLSTRSSVDSRASFNVNSFNVVSLGTSDISSIIPSVSSMASKGSESDNQLDKAFLNDSCQVKTFEPGKCLSARKCKNFMSIASTSKSTKLNNSFAGFNYVDRKLRFSDNCNDDSVFLEATQLAEVFRTSAAALDLNDEDISECAPPWVEDDVVFVDDYDEEIKENIDQVELNNDKISEAETVQDEREHKIKCNDADTLANNNNEPEVNNKVEENVISLSKESDKTDNAEVKNAKDLLNNLTAILNSSGTVVDQRKLGENLLNSLALALNIENPAVRNSNENSKPPNKLQRSKSDSRVSEKSRFSFTKQENKLTVPKLKTQPVAPVKLEKNLKLKNEKEKVTTKGPLKALIPLTNMAKNKKSVTPKVILTNTTPPKQSLQNSFQIKKTSTPNEHKIKPPIAQSTPDITKMQGTDPNNGTPKSKRHFGFSISPLSRPASTGDISNVCLNNSLSPKNTSGSAPSLNKSASKIPSNTSIPTPKSLSRRNSVSDMSTSRSNILNRSYENKQAVRPPAQLKRSSSFQNKSTTAAQKVNPVDNNNTMKKYGIPGMLKSLKLVPKAKKSTDK